MPFVKDQVCGSTKEELLETVWAGRVVEENTLTQAISILRKALGASAGDHRYILTVPGRGYRFVADATEEASAITLPASDPPQAQPEGVQTAVAEPLVVT